jgi:hypothetical protein
MGFNLFKKKGRNLAFFITLEPPIPYPSEETRTKIFTPSLTKIFGEYFDNVAISWFMDKNGKLDLIIVGCYDAKFSYKRDEEYAYMKYLLDGLSLKLEGFFNPYGTKATISDLLEPTPSSFTEYISMVALAKSEHKPLKSMNLFREFHHPLRKYDYLIFKHKEKGKAIETTKSMFKELVEKGITEARINPEHPNVIEIKDKKTGKWEPLIVVTDPVTRYTPKGKKEHAVRIS